MPTPRKYASAAHRQAAYRIRCRERAQAAGRRAPFAASPGRRRWEAMCGQALSLLQAVSQEMEAYAGARTEAWQESERGEAFQETLEAVAQTADALGEVDFS